jgi:phosphate/sulfate permease
MAYTTISLTNGVEIKKAPIGYSWTTLLFGGFPALFRQDWITGILVIIGSWFTFGIVGIIMSFIYNKIYAKSLFEKGYRIHALPNGVTEQQIKESLGYIKFPYEV